MFVIVLGIGILSAVLGGKSGNPPAPKTAEQLAQEQADTKRFGLATSVSQALRKAARDPDSLTFDSMMISEDGKIACAEYRAKNGFGGFNREIVVFVNGSPKTDVDTWNKRCAKKPLLDYLYAVK